MTNSSKTSPPYVVHRLNWSDPEYGSIDTPKRPMRLRGGFGSGLSMLPGQSGTAWALCDRGPNLKIETAVERFGLAEFESYEGADGAKIMPRLDLGPSIAELRIDQDRVELVRTIRIADADGKPLSGLPIPAGARAQCEPALDLDGNQIEPDPGGIDSEGIAALGHGGFWISDEYGPSLLKLDAEGRVELRLLPEGIELPNAPYPCRSNLPAIAVKRQLNRGFEAIALSQDGETLFVAFQSPLAHPDRQAHEKGRHVRIWRIDTAAGSVTAQYLYKLDPPKTFLRDAAKEKVKRSDLKISEMTALGDDTLLVLERGSETTKIYRVAIEPEKALDGQHLDESTRPTVEELSAAEDFPLPVLEKTLVFNSDDVPEIAADLEGMTLLSPNQLLLVNDNDFGTEGADTSFWRISFDAPLSG